MDFKRMNTKNLKDVVSKSYLTDMLLILNKQFEGAKKIRKITEMALNELKFREQAYKEPINLNLLFGGG
ncbi:MAG: hypothetical protein J7L15_07520 [Clostridiales bacterium]|nr:hypothetical protein [Clostridiales bacterium]